MSKYCVESVERVWSVGSVDSVESSESFESVAHSAGGGFREHGGQQGSEHEV